ncbi:MAG TPA: type II toxin-antitoxin system HicB family antitoxin [Bacteroidetes bacterium]|nr:type II toxin-antitoxin system HicB family antitoxin [Bacteroidota bacterium]
MEKREFQILNPDARAALEKGKEYFAGNEFRVILFKESGEEYFVAHCLEMDVVSHGETANEALENLIEAMAFHVEYYIDNHMEDQIMTPAPPELWTRFMSREAESSETIRFGRRGRRRGQPRLTARRYGEPIYSAY